MAETNPTVALLPDHDSLAKDPKATENFSKEVENLFIKVDSLVTKGLSGVEEATEEILFLEKKTRQACDGISTSKLCCKLLQLQKDANQWEAVFDFIISLSKKRGQLKKSISDMMELGMCWINDLKEKDIKMKLIKTLATISEGKIFVECERARLIKLQAEILEEEGKIDEAALLLQEIQVETFGAMNRKEKSLYILNQMRLVLLRNDFVRLQILSKKIIPKLLEAIDFQDIKLQYYKCMVLYHLHEKNYFGVAESYWSSFNTPKIQTTDEWQECLSNYVIFLILSPHSEEVLKLLEDLKNNEIKKLDEIPVIRNLVMGFLSAELYDWPVPYEQELRQFNAFQSDNTNEDRWSILRSRFLQHNALILDRYYHRIPMSRAAQLLNTNEDETEKTIADLVNAKIIYAKIDRPAGIIQFGRPLTSAQKLDVWSSDVSSLLDLLQETTHLISNDRMVHSALEKRKQLLEKSKVN